MSWYELFLFLHIVAAIVWLGSGGLIQIQAMRAERSGDAEGLRRAADDGANLAETVFIPSSLAVVILGVLLVLEGPWAFDQLWIVLGLVGYAATFLTGLFVMKPGGEKVAALMERDGLSAEALLETRKLLVKGRVDLVVLYLVVAVMALKPTGGDVGLLAAMAAIVVAGVAFVALRLRALDAEAAQPAAAAS